jgi:hypothetical protein
VWRSVCVCGVWWCVWVCSGGIKNEVVKLTRSSESSWLLWWGLLGRRTRVLRLQRLSQKAINHNPMSVSVTFFLPSSRDVQQPCDVCSFSALARPVMKRRGRPRSHTSHQCARQNTSGLPCRRGVCSDARSTAWEYGWHAGVVRLGTPHRTYAIVTAPTPNTFLSQHVD